MNDKLQSENFQMDFYAKQNKKKQINKLKKTLFAILGVFILVIVLLLLVGKLPFTLARSNKETTYNNVISMAVKNHNPLITDIAMLGANDAFSSEITTKTEIIIPDTDLSRPFIKTFADGAMSRYLRRQHSSVNDLLYGGIRYFDVKVAYYKEAYYTENIYLIKKIDSYLVDIMKFLSENPKEFVILDFSRISFFDKTFSDFYQYLLEIKYLETTIFDYIHYDSSKPLSELRYNDVIGNNGGIILLLDLQDQNKLYYNRNEVLITIEYDHSSNVKLVNAINEKANQKLDEAKLRINKACLTPKSDFNTIINWSILRMADWFNATILAEDLSSWFNTMPILVVDFADSGRGSFNRNINEFIIEYNEKRMENKYE